MRRAPVQPKSRTFCLHLIVSLKLLKASPPCCVSCIFTSYSFCILLHANTVICLTWAEMLYLEPRDVQQQLNHLSSRTQPHTASTGNVEEARLTKSCLLHCEICSFNTEHLSSIRRHYRNRHGKKMLKCKDCGFVTGLRYVLIQYNK